MKRFTKYVLVISTFSLPDRTLYRLHKYKFGSKTDESKLLSRHEAIIIVEDLWRNGYKVKLDLNVSDQEIRDMFYYHNQYRNLPKVNVPPPPPPPTRENHDNF